MICLISDDNSAWLSSRDDISFQANDAVQERESAPTVVRYPRDLKGQDDMLSSAPNYGNNKRSIDGGMEEGNTMIIEALE
jgi:hypothetical protein